MVGVLANASLLRAFQPQSSDSIHSVYSGLRPIYATQSHPQTLDNAQENFSRKGIFANLE